MKLSENKSKTTRKRVTSLGSTGSVGCSTVDLIARMPEQFPVQALVANKNWQVLAEQALKLKPKRVVLADHAGYND
nr:1-deoxy-D-xylulose-5-phosphate reductoisomerase [Alphaproteobacteria bacterium]